MTTVAAPASAPKPTQRPEPKPPAPPTPPAAPALNVRLAWDKDFFARDQFVGLNATLSEQGATVSGFVSGQAWGRDTKLRKGDMVQGLIANYFLEAIARNEPGLQELKSNYDPAKKFAPGNGQFDLYVDRPGTDNDLRYVGLLTAMPKPIADLLNAAREVREHF